MTSRQIRNHSNEKAILVAVKSQTPSAIGATGFVIHRLLPGCYSPENALPVAVKSESGSISSHIGWWKLTSNSTSIIDKYGDDTELEIHSKPSPIHDPDDYTQEIDNSSWGNLLVYKDKHYQLGLPDYFIKTGTKEEQLLVNITSDDLPEDSFYIDNRSSPKCLPLVYHKLKQMVLSYVSKYPDTQVALWHATDWDIDHDADIDHKTGRAVALSVYVLSGSNWVAGNETDHLNLLAEANEVGFDYSYLYPSSNRRIKFHVFCAIKRPSAINWLNRSIREAHNDYDICNYYDCKSYLNGSWTRFINAYFDTNLGQPIILLPASHTDEEGVNILPNRYQNDLTLGKILLWTTHANNLTPRIYFANFNDRLLKRATISFISPPREFKNINFRPTTTETLEIALKHPLQTGDDGRFSTCNSENPRGISLSDLISLLNESYPGIEFIAHKRLRSQFVCFDMPCETTLCEILDVATMLLNAVWDWCGDKKVYILQQATT